MSLLARMPITAGFLAEMGRAFGRDMVIDAVRRAADHGEPTFYACENGIEIGPRIPEGVGVTGRDLVIASVPSIGKTK